MLAAFSGGIRASKGYKLGELWQDPLDPAIATRQTSALDALIAWIAMHPRRPAGLMFRVGAK